MANNRLIYDILQGKNTLNKGLDSAKKKSSELSDSIKSIAGGFTAGALVTKGIFALGGAVRNVTADFLEFDKRVREINTILPDSRRVTSQLRGELKDLSASFGTKPAEQARAFYQIISSGTTDAVEATKLLNAANQLALGGIADLGGSINVLTDIVNVYGQENISAQEATDSLFQTVRLGKTTVEQLSSSLGQVLPTAQQLGVSLDDVNATLATMTTRGLTTAERVTQLNAIFTALLRKQKQAASFGTEVAEAFSLTALRTKGLSGFLEDLIKATNGSKVVLQQLLGRTEAVRGILTLSADGFVTLNKNIEEFTDKSGAAAAAADEIKSSLEFKFDQAIQNYKNFGISVLEVLEPIGRLGLAIANLPFTISKAVSKAIKANQNAANDLGKVQERVKSLTVDIEKLEAKRAEEASDAKRNRKGVLELFDLEIDRLRRLKELETERLSGLKDLNNAKKEAGAIDGELTDEELTRIRALNDFKASEAQRVRDEDLARKAIEKDEDLQFISEQLGAEEAIKIKADAIALNRENKFKEESVKINAAKNKAKITQEKKFQNAKAKLDSELLATEKAITNKTIGLAREAALAFVTLAGGSTKAAFAIQQAAAIAGVFVDDGRARASATAAAALTAASAPGPVGLALAAKTKAALDAAITKSTALSLGIIGAQAIGGAKGAGFQDGGVVGNGSLRGDRTLAFVNRKERVLTDDQNQAFERLAFEGGTGSDDTNELLTQVLEVLTSDRVTNIELDGRNLARAINRNRRTA